MSSSSTLNLFITFVFRQIDFSWLLNYTTYCNKFTQNLSLKTSTKYILFISFNHIFNPQFLSKTFSCNFYGSFRAHKKFLILLSRILCLFGNGQPIKQKTTLSPVYLSFVLYIAKKTALNHLRINRFISNQTTTS